LSKERIRSFIAVDISDEKVMKCILSLQKAISDTNVDLKLVEIENIYITIRFLGEISACMVKEVSGLLKTIQFSPFEVEFRDVGVFPSFKRINVVWIGIQNGVTELENIFNKIESRLKTLGFRSDTRGFKPHVTVARVRSARNKDRLTEAILGMRNKELGTMLVNSVKLKKSVLTTKGSIYSTLCEVKGIEN